MTSGTVEVAVLSLLGVVAQLAPGVLAALSGKQTDADAITAARDHVRALKSLAPEFKRIADERRAKLNAELGPLLSNPALTDTEKLALRALLTEAP